MKHDAVVIIPTIRQPPVTTLEAFSTGDWPVIIQADPRVFPDHAQYYRESPHLVVIGGEGIANQLAAAYQSASSRGFPFWFKVDDDLPRKSFVDIEGKNPDLPEVLGYLRSCIRLTHTTHAGLSNTTRANWLTDKYSRSFALIHGGINIAASSQNPWKYIDPRIVRSGDVYRSCAHRRESLAVGRVGFIGVNKNLSTKECAIDITREQLDGDKEIILSQFADLLEFTGVKTHHGNMMLGWKFKRGNSWRPGQ